MDLKLEIERAMEPLRCFTSLICSARVSSGGEIADVAEVLDKLYCLTENELFELADKFVKGESS